MQINAEDLAEGEVTKEKIIKRIKDKVANDLTLNKFYCCVNYYNMLNKKNKDKQITCIVIFEYVKQDSQGNRIIPSKRFKYTIFCTNKPQFDKNNVLLQLLTVYITGLETEEEKKKAMPSYIDISNRSIPGNNFYSTVKGSGLFEAKKCYIGTIDCGFNLEDIPNKFKPLM